MSDRCMLSSLWSRYVLTGLQNSTTIEFRLQSLVFIMNTRFFVSVIEQLQVPT